MSHKFHSTPVEEIRATLLAPCTRVQLSVLRPLRLVCDGVGEHWEQRLGVKLAQGEASLVLSVVASAWVDVEGISGWKASPEWSQTDCQPCVGL